MPEKRDGRYVWVTWLSKLMAGETTCEWSPWFKTNYRNYEKAPSDFDAATWQINHTRLLREVRIARENAGDELLVERQAQFQWVRPATGLIVAGRPDLVAIRPDEVCVMDVKTGAQKASDSIQVMIYLHCLPQDAPVYRNRALRGKLVYPGYELDVGIDAAFSERFDYFLDILDSAEAATRLPSVTECRYCDIARSECPDRMDEAGDLDLLEDVEFE